MKVSSWTASALLVGILGSFGCNGSKTVTGPPASIDLTGVWSGTVLSLDGFCGTETFSVSISQTAGADGDPFTGQFSTACGGSFDIHGILSGGRLFGSITGKGRITGTATSTQIEITVIQGSGGLDNGQSPVDRIVMQHGG